LTSCQRLRIEHEGIDLDYIGRTRHIPYKDIALVDAELVAMRHEDWTIAVSRSLGVTRNAGTRSFSHVLVIGEVGGRTHSLEFNKDSFAVRDTIVAAAALAGVDLSRHEQTGEPPA